MTAKTDSVEKLDRTQPPPGYEVSEWGNPPGWFWYPDPCEDAQNCGAPLATEAAALAAAWAHYECEHDPPGLQVHAWGYGRREAEQPWWRAWPVCLTWSDAQVAEVERWLAEGGEPPEVLRA